MEGLMLIFSSFEIFSDPISCIQKNRYISAEEWTEQIRTPDRAGA
jgi:hypothetical protein